MKRYSIMTKRHKYERDDLDEARKLARELVKKGQEVVIFDWKIGATIHGSRVDAPSGENYLVYFIRNGERAARPLNMTKLEKKWFYMEKDVEQGGFSVCYVSQEDQKKIREIQEMEIAAVVNFRD